MMLHRLSRYARSATSVATLVAIIFRGENTATLLPKPPASF